MISEHPNKETPYLILKEHRKGTPDLTRKKNKAWGVFVSW